MKTKEIKRVLLVVDGENLLHRSFHKFEKFKSSEGEPTGAVYGFFKSLHSVIFRFNPTSVIVTFDNGRSKHRTKVLPEYKSGRKKLGMDYESLQKQKRLIMRILRLLWVPYIYDNPFRLDYEADDYIALLAKKYEGNVMILSSDKDFHQLISRRVKIISPAKDEVITVNNCKAITGYEPEQCVDYLTLDGDSSDSIPGYPGIGPKKAMDFLNLYSIANFLKNESYSQKGIDKNKLRDLYIMNRNLIDLDWFITVNPIKPIEIPIVYGHILLETNRLNRLLARYSLMSFQTTQFTNLFKELKIWKPNV